MDRQICAGHAAVENYSSKCVELFGNLKASYTGVVKPPACNSANPIPWGPGRMVLMATCIEIDAVLTRRSWIPTIYSGDWVCGKPHGNGLVCALAYSRAKNLMHIRYSGTWVKGRMQGEGTKCITLAYPEYAKDVAVVSQVIHGVFGGNPTVMNGKGTISLIFRERANRQCPCGCNTAIEAPMQLKVSIESDNVVNNAVCGKCTKSFPCGTVMKGAMHESVAFGEWITKTSDGRVLKGTMVGMYASNYCGRCSASDSHGLVVYADVGQNGRVTNNSILKITRYDGAEAEILVTNGKLSRKVAVTTRFENGIVVKKTITRPDDECDCLKCARDVWGPAPQKLRYERILRSMPACKHAVKLPQEAADGP
jgi:hypothetical protein